MTVVVLKIGVQFVDGLIDLLELPGVHVRADSAIAKRNLAIDQLTTKVNTDV